MNAGIGASGAGNAHRRIGYRRQCALECVLDAAAVGLRLEAAERAPIVLEAQRMAHATRPCAVATSGGELGEEASRF